MLITHSLFSLPLLHNQLQGRRTASFKSTYDAINSGLQNMNDFNVSYRDSAALNNTNSSNLNSSLTNSSANASSAQFNEGYYPRMNKRIRTASHLNEMTGDLRMISFLFFIDFAYKFRFYVF